MRALPQRSVAYILPVVDEFQPLQARHPVLAGGPDGWLQRLHRAAPVQPP